MPALSTQQYSQTASRLDAVDNTYGWFHSSDMPHDIQLSTLARPPILSQAGYIPTTPRTTRHPHPPPSDITHLTAVGPLTNEMRYPETHSVPHGGTTRASFRRTRLGSIGTVDRDWYRGPSATANIPAAGSLRRKSNDVGQPRETTFGTPRVGPRPGEYVRKHEVPLPGDWTAASELEYRV